MTQFLPLGKRPAQMTPAELRALPEAPENKFLCCDVMSDDALHSWQDADGRWQPQHDGERWYKRRLLF